MRLYGKKYLQRILFLLLIVLPVHVVYGQDALSRSVLVTHIKTYYPQQLTNPQKKIRRTLSQFGYNLSYFAIPIFPITDFIRPGKYGRHSFSKPGRGEKNGCLYTCRGGFIDFSHLRAALDWTVYLTFSILSGQDEIELAPEAGSLQLRFTNTGELTVDDIAGLAQKIAFERLAWHEVASWHYHRPYRAPSDQQSAFTPEDSYSNFLGTEIGKKVALRILRGLETLPFSQVASEEIGKAIADLQPVPHIRESKMAYDIVDREKQLKLPADKRNSDVWWDSKILFRDQRYIFKRDIELGPEIDPWIVPQSGQLGCDIGPGPEIFIVPQQSQNGHSLTNYYDFTITPDTAMFYGRKGKRVHTGFPAFSTKQFNYIVCIIAAEMEKVLSAGFDQRDCCDPVCDFTHLRRVGLAVVMKRSRN